MKFTVQVKKICNQRGILFCAKEYTNAEYMFLEHFMNVMEHTRGAYFVNKKGIIEFMEKECIGSEDTHYGRHYERTKEAYRLDKDTYKSILNEKLSKVQINNSVRFINERY